MDTRYQDLFQTLTDYLEAVSRQNEPDAPDLLTLFQKLDAEEKAVTSFAPPQLKHYLFKKSYRKAYLFLQGRDAENDVGPTC